ncbi:NUDIX domain-containing protein [Puia sp. P3]|uniref:NUDIX domain-containing protein n=1 Tax=Puia sp. P3 TaxID=3423952 RepID=UPI003D671001
MDFGATVCLPRNPLCTDCVQRPDCKALLKGLTAELPVKEKSIRKRSRWFYYFIIETPDDRVYIHQRTQKDIWEGLYEFILWETDQPLNNGPGELLPGSGFAEQTFGINSKTLTIRHISKTYRQELSHQTIQGQFVTLRTKKNCPPRRLAAGRPATTDRLSIPEIHQRLAAGPKPGTKLVLNVSPSPLSLAGSRHRKALTVRPLPEPTAGKNLSFWLK